MVEPLRIDTVLFFTTLFLVSLTVLGRGLRRLLSTLFRDGLNMEGWDALDRVCLDLSLGTALIPLLATFLPYVRVSFNRVTTYVILAFLSAFTLYAIVEEGDEECNFRNFQPR